MIKIDNLEINEENLLRPIGVERERYIIDPKTGIISPKTGKLIPSTCKIVSRIGDLLPLVWEIAVSLGIPEPEKRFIYEGPASQIEDITYPMCN